jgi:hypothetical protein
MAREDITSLYAIKRNFINQKSYDENMKEKPKFSLARKDEEILDLVSKTDKKTLAVWAIDCAERVMPFFEERYPKDKRPRKAIETLQ